MVEQGHDLGEELPRDHEPHSFGDQALLHFSVVAYPLSFLVVYSSFCT